MSDKPKISASRVVITSFMVDLSDIVLNVLAALLSGSIVMLTQSLQGAADLLTSGLLWLGVSRSKRAAKRSSFGYGRELFFWILMAGVSMFVITAGLSFYLGLERFLHPQPVTDLAFAYAVLAIGIATNFYAFRLSLARLGGWRLSLRKAVSVVTNSNLIESKSTLVLDMMGTIASLLGLAALIIYGITGNYRWDGLGAMIVGAASAFFAVLLIAEVRDLIAGRSASPEIKKQISTAAQAVNGVIDVLDLRTMMLGSENLLVNIEVHFEQQLRTPEIEKITDEIKRAIKRAVPIVQHVQVEVETPNKR